MDDLVHRTTIFICITEFTNHLVRHPYDLAEFFKIERKHIYDIHITDRLRAKVFQFHSKQRARQCSTVSLWQSSSIVKYFMSVWVLSDYEVDLQNKKVFLNCIGKEQDGL